MLQQIGIATSRAAEVHRVAVDIGFNSLLLQKIGPAMGIFYEIGVLLKAVI